MTNYPCRRTAAIHNKFDKKVHTFLKGISLKVNTVARLDFELANFEVTVLDVSHYASGSLFYIHISVWWKLSSNFGC